MNQKVTYFMLVLFSGLGGYGFSYLWGNGSGERDVHERVVPAVERNVAPELAQMMQMTGHARPVTRVEAYTMFSDYHQAENYVQSKGVFGFPKGEPSDPCEMDSVIVSINLMNADFMIPMAAALDSVIGPGGRLEGKMFKGYAGIPVLVARDGAVPAHHSLVWAALVGDSASTDSLEYVFPVNDNEHLLYQYNPLCPTNCPKKTDILWKTDWE